MLCNSSLSKWTHWGLILFIHTLPLSRSLSLSLTHTHTHTHAHTHTHTHIAIAICQNGRTVEDTGIQEINLIYIHIHTHAHVHAHAYCNSCLSKWMHWGGCRNSKRFKRDKQLCKAAKCVPPALLWRFFIYTYLYIMYDIYIHVCIYIYVFIHVCRVCIYVCMHVSCVCVYTWIFYLYDCAKSRNARCGIPFEVCFLYRHM